MSTAQDGGKVVSLTHRSPLPARRYTWYSFLTEAESNPGPQCDDRKDYVTEKFHCHQRAAELLAVAVANRIRHTKTCCVHRQRLKGQKGRKEFITLLARDGILLESLRCKKKKNLFKHIRQIMTIRVAARSKACVCGRSLAGIAGSNAAEGMDVCLL